MIRAAFLVIALSGCAGVPAAGWIAIGTVAGTIGQIVKLDEAGMNAYLATKGKTITPIAPTSGDLAKPPALLYQPPR